MVSVPKKFTKMACATDGCRLDGGDAAEAEVVGLKDQDLLLLVPLRVPVQPSPIGGATRQDPREGV